MNYFFHGTGDNLEVALDIMIRIIKTGAIQSKNKRKSKDLTLFNGDDYISVARWEEGFDYENLGMIMSSLYGWVYGCPTFIISPDIEAVHTSLYRGGFYDPKKDRVSQFVDEWHVKDEIPIDKVVGIAIPFDFLGKNPFALSLTKKILEYARAYEWKVYNSDINLIKSIENDETYNLSINKRNY